MANEGRLIRRFGSVQDTGEIKTLVAGPLSLDIDSGKLRNIQWYGVELIRAFDYPIRDPNWGTVAVTVNSESVEQNDEDWTYRRLFTSTDGRLAGEFNASGDRTGHLSVEVSFSAGADFETARTGFTVLHPIKGLAGGDVEVTHGDGGSEMLVFPKGITPDQPVFDMAGLTYSIFGMKAEITFEGEVFEMEDQRNWTDASYKTYCRPLSRPSPFLIPKGETLRQKITVSFSGDGPQASIDGSRVSDVFGLLDQQEPIPEVLLALEPDFLPDTNILPICQNLQVVRGAVRVKNEDECHRVLQTISDLGLSCDLEIIVPNTAVDAADLLMKIAHLCGERNILAEHVVAVPEDYMKSYQPDGDWPGGLTPQASVALGRNAFPNSEIGGGVLTNFTELNRCRPVVVECDFVTHSTTAIVHAADDKSVFETLEAQPDVYASGRAIAPEIGYRMGLVSIAFRTNPYGPAPLANPQQNRLEMVQADPRQRGLFAAAWMVGAMATTQGYRINSIALAAPVGPLGVIYRREDWPQPLFDDQADRIVYPAYHTLKALAQMAGQSRRPVRLADGLFGVAAQSKEGMKAILSNGTAKSQQLKLPSRGHVLLLNEKSFDAATQDMTWLESADRNRTDEIELGPYAVAFLDPA